MSSLDAKCVEAYLGLPFELLFSVHCFGSLDMSKEMKWYICSFSCQARR